MIGHPNLRYLLQQWKSWSTNPQEVADWVQKQIDGSEVSFFKILDAFYYDDWTRKGYRLNLKEGRASGRYMILDQLSDFASVNDIKDRLDQMNEEDLSAEQKETRHAFYLAYEDWSKRKPSAGRPEPEPQIAHQQEPEREVSSQSAPEPEAAPQLEPTSQPDHVKPKAEQ